MKEIITKNMSKEEKLQKERYFVEFVNDEIKKYESAYSDVKAICGLSEDGCILMEKPTGLFESVEFNDLELYVDSKEIIIAFDGEKVKLGLMSQSKLDRAGIDVEFEKVYTGDDYKAIKKVFTSMKLNKNNDWYGEEN